MNTKNKITLTFLLAAIMCVIFAFSVGAAALSKEFVDVKLTLVDGTETTGYLAKGGTWNGYQGYTRKTIYADYKDSSLTIAWDTVKVFDMRESEIQKYDSKTDTLTKTGTYPQTLLEGPSSPTNITHVYYPQGAVIIANNSFRKDRGWESLEYVWIPSSLKIIGEGSFGSTSTLATVEFEKGSTLIEIDKNAFDSCTSLTSFDFPETLEIVDYCAFWKSGLSGTVKLPNSVTTIGDGAFRNTKIEVLNLGAGVTKVGYHLIGDSSENKEFLKAVYIPSTAILSSGNEGRIFFNGKNVVEIYVVGDNYDALVSSLQTKRTNSSYMNIVLDENKDTYEGTYHAVIKTGYNLCDVFYNGEHQKTDDGTLKYVDAVTEFYKATVCSKCGNEMKTSDTYAPILTFLGYSVKDSGNALCVGYDVNNTSYKVYTETFGKVLKYGIICAVSSEDNAFIEAKDGDVSIIDGKKAVLASVGSQYSSFEFKLTGFTEATFNTALVMCAYSYDGTSIKYLFENSQDTPLAVALSQVK